MTEMFTPAPPHASQSGIIKLAVLAVGGQGGGVLTGWIEAVGRAQGYAVQATSVAGVAQRTGATIYYVEMAPKGDTAPIFSLAPSAGDVDIMIAAEMMEAGRSIMRGFVTPDRTTLIASSHRALAVSEKMVPGDGIANADEVRAAAEVAAQRLILNDFDALALSNGSVISSSLFGALAGSGALPFPRDAFEDAIRKSGRGVEASLRAFAAGFDTAQAGVAPAELGDQTAGGALPAPQGPERMMRKWRALEARLDEIPVPARDMAARGLRKVVAFQDLRYGGEYLERLMPFVTLDDGARDWALSTAAAKHVANAMAYDDVIRVADEKTRATRLERIRTEMGGAEVMQLTEYTHPSATEIVSLLPAGLGRWIEARPRLFNWIDRRVNKGRRLRTDRVWPFVQLYVLGGLKRTRRASLRHATEVAHLEAWLERVKSTRAQDYALAVEMLNTRRLIKGYSDTHARGLSKFDLVMSGIEMVAGRDDAADWARRLRKAALQDEEGAALNGLLDTIRSFV